MVTRARMMLSGAVVAMVLGAGCGEAEAVPELVSTASLAPGDVVPTPTGGAAITLTGAIGTTNVDSVLVLDIATIERLEVVRAEVFEPYEARSIEFSGVDLADLLAVAGIAEDAREVHIRALDDYAVTLTVEAILDGGIVLATRADGQPVGIEEGGPARIVFLDGVPAGGNSDLWIWSVEAIEVRT